MGALEIVLLIAGGIIFVLSFLIPQKEEKAAAVDGKYAKEEIKQLVAEEMESVRDHVDEVVEEAVGYAMEKTERSLERLSNEKIMAVNEYSDTVLAEIHKNHEEAMFLYDMLNSKHTNLKNTASEVDRTVKEAEEKMDNLKRSVTAEDTKKMESANAEVAKVEAGAKEVTVATFERLQPAHVEAASVQVGPAKDSAKKAETKTRAAAKKTGTTAAQEKSKSSDASKSVKDVESISRVSFMKEDADGRNSNEKILELHRAGKSRVAIARELGLGVGEVKLVLDLYQNQ